MRLIDADALKKTLEKLWNVHDDQDFADKDVWREIENAPTEGPERTAKVENRIWQKDLTLIGGGSWSGKCHECGRWGKSNECTYCPKCGAKLEWSDDERFD